MSEKNYMFKCVDGPPPKAEPHYGKGIARTSDVLSMWNDDPEERMTDWAAALGPYVVDGWRQERNRLAIGGTIAHEAIERYLTPDDGQLDPTIGTDAPDDEVFWYAETAFNNFLRWEKEEGVEILPGALLEETIHHSSMPYGGTCDFKGEIDFGDGRGPRKVMLDWKTSGSIKRKMKLQLAAYSMLHASKYGADDFDAYGILRLARDRERYELILWDNLDEEKSIFAALLTIYHVTTLRRPRVSVEKNQILRQTK